MKLLKENIGKKLLDIALGNDFFGYDTKSTSNKSKNRQVELYQTEKLLHSKGIKQQSAKGNLQNGRKYSGTTYLIEFNIQNE